METTGMMGDDAGMTGMTGDDAGTMGTTLSPETMRRRRVALGTTNH